MFKKAFLSRQQKTPPQFFGGDECCYTSRGRDVAPDGRGSWYRGHTRGAPFFVAAMFIFGMSKISLAMMCGGDSGHSEHTQVVQSSDSGDNREAISETKPSSGEAVNVGNKICPVSSDKIDQNLKATYEYRGKVYNFCCASCIDEFKKDPGKYIKKVDEELKSESEAEK